MYNTMQHIAKYIIDKVGLTKAVGTYGRDQYDIYDWEDGTKPTTLSNYINEMCEFCKNMVNNIKKEKSFNSYSSWKLISPTEVEIFYDSYGVDNKSIRTSMICQIPNIITPPNNCSQVQYNTYDKLVDLEIGDILDISFKEDRLVKKQYKGQTLPFVVHNYMKHNWRRDTKRLVLIPLAKLDTFEDDDILYLDDADRFECLMIDLFPINRVPYRGWKNKTVTFKKR